MTILDLRALRSHPYQTVRHAEQAASSAAHTTGAQGQHELRTDAGLNLDASLRSLAASRSAAQQLQHCPQLCTPTALLAAGNGGSAAALDSSMHTCQDNAALPAAQQRSQLGTPAPLFAAGHGTGAAAFESSARASQCYNESPPAARTAAGVARSADGAVCRLGTPSAAHSPVPPVSNLPILPSSGQHAHIASGNPISQAGRYGTAGSIVGTQPADKALDLFAALCAGPAALAGSTDEASACMPPGVAASAYAALAACHAGADLETQTARKAAACMQQSASHGGGALAVFRAAVADAAARAHRDCVTREEEEEDCFRGAHRVFFSFHVL